MFKMIMIAVALGLGFTVGETVGDKLCNKVIDNMEAKRREKLLDEVEKSCK